MTVVLERLVTKEGVVYQVGQPWPGAQKEEDDEKQLKVGLIFLRPEMTEIVGDDEDEEEAVPAHYEVWQVIDPIFAAFFATASGHDIGKENEEKLTEAMATGKVVRRTIPFSWVIADEQWPALDAFQVMTERLVAQNAEEGAAAGKDAEDNGAQAPTVTPTTATT